jgi:Ca2+-binding EF-hand superfamily protein
VLPGDAAQLRTRLLQRFDRDKDGQLNDEERAEAQKIAENRATDPAVVSLRMEFLRRFDQNTNGKIEGNEAVAVREFFADRAGQPAFGGFGAELRQDLTKRFDRNADGKIDETEMAAAAEGLRLGLAVAAVRGDRFDLNFDGRLSDDEWTSARQQLQRWLNGEMTFPSPVSTVVRNPTPEEEQARLRAVAAEVEKRRLLREEAGAAIGSISPPLIQSGPDPAISPRAEAEKARLEAVSAEVARRRAEREGAGK